MTLQNWLNSKWIETHQSTKEEVSNLLNKIEVNEMELKVENNSSDWRLAFAYNSIITIATIALRVSGYRIKAVGGHHEKTINSLRFTLETDSEIRLFIHAIRKQRNIAEYDAAGTISDQTVNEAIEISEQLKKSLLSWLKDNHQEYIE